MKSINALIFHGNNRRLKTAGDFEHRVRALLHFLLLDGGEIFTSKNEHSSGPVSLQVRSFLFLIL